MVQPKRARGGRMNDFTPIMFYRSKPSMKQFAENLRLRDIMVTLRPIIGARTFPLPDGISGPPAAHLTILKA